MVVFVQCSTFLCLTEISQLSSSVHYCTTEGFIMQLLSSSKASDTGYTGGRVLDLIVLSRKLYILAVCIHSGSYNLERFIVNYLKVALSTSILLFLLQLVNLVVMMAAQCYRYIQVECCLLNMLDAPLAEVLGLVFCCCFFFLIL